jgi:hypothetical protein
MTPIDMPAVKTVKYRHGTHPPPPPQSATPRRGSSSASSSSPKKDPIRLHMVSVDPDKFDCILFSLSRFDDSCCRSCVAGGLFFGSAKYDSIHSTAALWWRVWLCE